MYINIVIPFATGKAFTPDRFTIYIKGMKTIETLLADSDIIDRVVPRFLRYVRIWTTSDSSVVQTPSTPGQWDLARMLEQELLELGIRDVELTDNCYVIARIPASPGKEHVPTIGFMAHLDTAEDVSGKDVQPKLVKQYDGSRIELQDAYVLDPQENPDLLSHIGDDIIHSDGSTLLGADNKAGIAEIMGAMDYIIQHPELEHGPLIVVFSPDEETGKGLPGIPLEKITAEAFYTLDGGPAGELEAECFNAYKALVTFEGISIHPGHARGRLVNAVLMAAQFAAMMPRNESPEASDGYYGFYSAMGIRGSIEKAELEIIIRDFDLSELERRLAALNTFAAAVEAQYPGGKVTVTSTLQYYNMKKKIDKNPRVMELLLQAAEKTGLTPYLKPIRGGTDGARLTELGTPTPNIFTGGRNFHSRTEWIPVSDMAAASRLVIKLIELWANNT